ncbi:MAG: PilN domain-containing protein [bacterium]
MINLLPAEQKSELILENRLKIVLILGITFLGFLISLTLILFIVEIFVLAEVRTQKIYFNQIIAEQKNSGAEEIEKEVIEYNQTFSELDSFYRGQFNLTQIFEKISSMLPSGSYLKTLDFSRENSAISLGGFALTREDLLGFKERLEDEESFTEIYFPPSAWSEPKDIDFMVIFKLNLNDIKSEN